MFFTPTFQHVWRWRKHFSHRQPFKQHPLNRETSTAENMRLRQHHDIAVHEQQKIARNHFLERRTFL